jgi:hypothetical protein
MRQQVWRDLFNRAASPAGRRDYSLFGMGIQRVDAERLECNPRRFALCENQSGEG